jgi:starch synthase (maltosyl-transferring)
MGFDVIYLPPIHPIGVTHRKGRNNSVTCEPHDVGSPWAIGGKEGGHDAVHPELGTIADFDALVKAAAEFGIEIALDYALQCSPDHPWVTEHPNWFFVRPDGTLRYAENPPKKYEDIYPINFWSDDRENLWNACRDVVLYWIQHGVKIFRVDNPHTKPLAFWEWMIADIQREHPDVIFLSESFTRPNRMKSLAKLGFTQSYTYFTWKNSSWELRDYLTELTKTDMVEYYRPNFFANTPDILHEYLQHGGRAAFRIRLVLAATLSPIYGIYSGYELCENQAVKPGSEEYLDSEKYEIRVRDWNAAGNIKQDVSKLNRIRSENAALHALGNLQMVQTDYDGIFAYRKHAPGNELLVVVNLDPHAAHETMVDVPIGAMGIDVNEAYEVTDLLTGSRYTWRGSRNYVRLDPNERVAHLFRISRRV